MKVFKKIKTRLNNETGTGMISAIGIFTLVSFMTVSLLQVSSADSESLTNNLQKSQSFYVATGGIEYAKRKLSLGESPDISNKAFSTNPDGGSFSISSNPSTKTLTVTGNYGIAKSTQTLTTEFANDCIGFKAGTSGFYSMAASNVAVIAANSSIVISCDLAQVKLDRVEVFWKGITSSAKITDVTMYNDDNIYYKDPSTNFSKTPYKADVEDYTMENGVVYKIEHIYMSYSSSDEPTTQPLYLALVFKDGSRYTTKLPYTVY